MVVFKSKYLGLFLVIFFRGKKVKILRRQGLKMFYIFLLLGVLVLEMV